jgi:hypothetical protein
MVLDLHIDTDRTVHSARPAVRRLRQGPNGPRGPCRHEFYDDKAIVAEGGWAMVPPFGFEMSFNIMLEKATLVYDCTRTPAFRVCQPMAAHSAPVGPGDGYSRQTDYFVESILGKSSETV